MVQPTTPPANRFVRLTRKVYNPIGFGKGYNFILFFIFGGALLGFVLARSMYFNVSGVFCGPPSASNHAAPGECYYYTNIDQYKIGIRLHLYTILPAGFLAVFQFVPAIRHNLILLHRMTGYTVLVLLLVSNAGAIMIARRAFGGTLATQALVGTLAILTTTGSALAYYNIKVLQIDQHRAWMLRVWFWAGSIITLRFILPSASSIIGMIGDYYMVQPCEKLYDIFGYEAGALIQLYPACAAFVAGGATRTNTFYAIVNANFAGNAAEITTAMNLSFGMAGWLALVLHAAGVEIYLHLTPKESLRLRTVSYQRQLEAGFKNAGNAGLTPQRLGDAEPFVPQKSPQAPVAAVAPATSFEKPSDGLEQGKAADLDIATGNHLRPQISHKQVSDASSSSSSV